MVESKKIVEIKLDLPLSEALKENLIEKPEQAPVQIPFAEEEPGLVDKERILKRWKESKGNYYLNPDKFLFSLKDL